MGFSEQSVREHMGTPFPAGSPLLRYISQANDVALPDYKVGQTPERFCKREIENFFELLHSWRSILVFDIAEMSKIEGDVFAILGCQHDGLPDRMGDANFVEHVWLSPKY